MGRPAWDPGKLKQWRVVWEERESQVESRTVGRTGRCQKLQLLGTTQANRISYPAHKPPLTG